MTFIFRNTENSTCYAPEHRKIPIDRPGKLSESFLFLSVLVCEAVVLCLVQSRWSLCVLAVFSVEQSVHFQYFNQVCHGKNVTECLAKIC